MEKVINFPKVLIIGGNSLVGSTLSNYVKDTFDLYHTYHNTTISSKNSIQIDLVKEPQKILDLINKIKPSLVIHTVAYPNIDFCENESLILSNLCLSIFICPN